MRLPEPIRMERIAVVAPQPQLRAVLGAVAEAGLVEPQLTDREGALDTLPDDVALETVLSSAVSRGRVSAIAGWTPAASVDALAERLRPLGGAVVIIEPLPLREPPTLLAGKGTNAAFMPLVETYATMPYRDVNPSLFAGLAYIVMFGMMFGDVGHGLILLLAGVVLLRSHAPAIARFRKVAPFVVGAGISSMVFGLAYGEAFGPTKLVPTLWLSPLAAPITLLGAGVAVGAVLLAISYGLGTANRWREGGFGAALVALSGIAGSALYVGLALIGWGSYRGSSTLAIGGGGLCAIGLVLGYGGLYAESGGRASGAVQAGVELFDAVVRLGSNVISFARLAAFGMTHAALGEIVWGGTTLLLAREPVWWPLAAVVFVAGNAVTFCLEALIAGIQALRLDYYELFSRIFIAQGRAFMPWRLATLTGKEG